MIQLEVDMAYTLDSWRTVNSICLAAPDGRQSIAVIALWQLPHEFASVEIGEQSVGVYR